MDINSLEYAKKFPILFSQVREDPQIDIGIVDSIHKEKMNILMIASGGCTLGVLARHPKIASIDAIDLNKAQIDISKLKLFLLNEPPQTRAEILGHYSLENRKEKLSAICESLDIQSENFGDPEAVNTYGPDYVGRYEWLFRFFSEQFIQTQLGIQLQQITSIEEQRQLLNNSDLSEIQSLFDTTFSLHTLVELFGPNAVQNRKTPYSHHFYTQFIWSLTHQFIRSNPFFYQFAYLSYPKFAQTHYLSLSQGKPTEVHFYALSMLECLTSCKMATYDYIHLSNILDWLDIDSIQQILGEVSRVLKPGGKVSIRQLNSTVKIEDYEDISFERLCNDRLITNDLSFFYPTIYIGEKK